MNSFSVEQKKVDVFESAAPNKPVIYLKRLTMGPLKLDPSLGPGEWRPLTGEEISALRGGSP